MAAKIAGSNTYLNDTLATIKRHDSTLLDVLGVTYHPYTYNPDDVVLLREPSPPCLRLTLTPQYGDDELVDYHLKLVHTYSPKIRLLQGECGAPSQVQVSGSLESSMFKRALCLAGQVRCTQRLQLDSNIPGQVSAAPRVKDGRSPSLLACLLARWDLRRMIGDVGYTGQDGGIPTSIFSIVDMCYTSVRSHSRLVLSSSMPTNRLGD